MDEAFIKKSDSKLDRQRMIKLLLAGGMMTPCPNDIISICSNCGNKHEKTYGDGEWCENCVPYYRRVRYES